MVVTGEQFFYEALVANFIVSATCCLGVNAVKCIYLNALVDDGEEAPNSDKDGCSACGTVRTKHGTNVHVNNPGKARFAQVMFFNGHPSNYIFLVFCFSIQKKYFYTHFTCYFFSIVFFFLI